MQSCTELALHKEVGEIHISSSGLSTWKAVPFQEADRQTDGASHVHSWQQDAIGWTELWLQLLASTQHQCQGWLAVLHAASISTSGNEQQATGCGSLTRKKLSMHCMLAICMARPCPPGSPHTTPSHLLWESIGRTQHHSILLFAQVGLSDSAHPGMLTPCRDKSCSKSHTSLPQHRAGAAVVLLGLKTTVRVG